MAEQTAADRANFTLSISDLDAPIEITQFWGEEGISQLFHFSIVIESSELGIKPADVAGVVADFTFGDRGQIRTVHGLISRFEHVGCDPERKIAVYSLDLVSDLFHLSQRQQSRIFQQMGADAILMETLETAMYPTSRVKNACNQKHSVREFCVQYRETDLNFFSRIAESAGIFYFFDHANDDAKLMIGDTQTTFEPIAESGEIRFQTRGGPTAYDDFIYEFRLAQEVRSGSIMLRAVNFEHPRKMITVESAGDVDQSLEVYDYPGDFQVESDGKKLARIRQEAEESQRVRGSALSNSVRLVPGYKFTLYDHKQVDSFNAEYLITSVSHNGSQPASDGTAGHSTYSNEVRFLPADIPYRPPLLTRRPTIEGTQTATVTGPDGHEINTDEHARVKVRFHWDRSDTPDTDSSCWIRVSQLWAGGSWGGMNIPRIGQEVLINFLEGDPDRPVITGRLYNGLNKPPYALPDKKTISTIKSNSSLGGGGFNELRFDDTKDAEEIYQHAQRNLTIETLNDKSQTTGNNETLSIGNNRTKSVKKDESTSIGGNRTETVTKNETVSIDGSRSLTVAKSETINITESRTDDVGKNETLSVGKDQSYTIGDNLKISVGKDSTAQVGKNYGLSAGDNIVLSADNEITLKCGSASIIMKSNGDILIKGNKLSLKGSGDVIIKGSKITSN